MTFVVEGHVASLALGIITVEGLDVHLTADTVIDGVLPLLGGTVRITGYFDANGDAIAETVSIG